MKHEPIKNLQTQISTSSNILEDQKSFYHNLNLNLAGTGDVGKML